MDLKPTVDLRLDARWVIPIAPAGALADHSVLIDAGRIVGVLPTRAAEAAYQVRRVESFSEHALLPGLVNAHSHAAMTLLRGVADDLPLARWLQEHIWPREAAHVSSEFVADGSLLAAAEMLRGGITCCNDMYFFPEATAQSLRRAGMRAMIGLAVLDFPTPYAADPDDYLGKGLAMRDAWRHDPMLRFALAPHAPYTVGDATLDRIVTYAEQLDLPVQIHLHETANEIGESLKQYGRRPLARLIERGALGPGFQAIHGVYLETAEIAELRDRGGHVVHCPSSNLKLASGIAPVASIIAAGLNLALGTDGAASNNRLDLFEEMRLAALLAKASSGDAAAMPAARALYCATLGGARALGWDTEIGSLEPGKAADLIAVDFAQIELSPCFEPTSQLVYAAGRNEVTDVWVAGERLLEQRQLKRLHHDELLARARTWQERLK
ncbi:MAG: TRZ/ATZ family hydrolase [Betaproteobacteria bacterium]|nr:TRZ/ATZ family hydrolase [Betaproteobacteria bacterium]